MAAMAPAAAQASTKDVYMGPKPADEKTFNKSGTDVDDFFPHGVTIHVGDSVAFQPVNFHSVDFPKKGVKGPQPLIVPDGKKVAGSNDAAGNPFWFNGQDEVSFNPGLFPPKFAGKTFTYTGKALLDSGPPVVPKPKPFVVKFTKVGTYTYFCDVHPGMKGVVHVVAKKAKAPSAKDDAKTYKKQVAQDLALAKKAGKAVPAAGTVDVGNAVGHGVEYFGFLPGNLSVKVGTTISFSIAKGSVEAHTVTFGPGDPEKDPNSFLGQIAGSFSGPGPFDSRAVYPSDPPGTPASFTSTSHGNGFWGSGVLDTDPASPQPTSNSVTFSQVGTYNYYCMIHPFMHGIVTVTN